MFGEHHPARVPSGARMKARILIAVAQAMLIASSPRFSMAQATATSPPPTTRAQTSGAIGLPERAVRRTMPMTNMIRRAFAAGTRDSTGRPGRNYWQLWTDYRISARLASGAPTVSGHEVVTDRHTLHSA